MLDPLEQKQGFGPFPIDKRVDLHADADSLRPNDTPHQANPLGEVDKHDVIRIGWRTRVDDGHRVNGSKPARDDPVPLAVAGSRLGDPGREKTAAAATGALQTQFALRQCFSPLVLGAHQAKL